MRAINGLITVVYTLTVMLPSRPHYVLRNNSPVRHYQICIVHTQSNNQTKFIVSTEYKCNIEWEYRGTRVIESKSAEMD